MENEKSLTLTTFDDSMMTAGFDRMLHVRNVTRSISIRRVDFTTSGITATRKLIWMESLDYPEPQVNRDYLKQIAPYGKYQH